MLHIPFLERVRSNQAFAVSLVVGVVLLLTGIRIQQWINNPRVYLLTGETDAKWIRAHSDFNLSTHSYFRPMVTMFRCDFELAQPVANGRIMIQAFRRCQVWLDTDPQTSEPLFSSPKDVNQWKRRHEIRLPDPLEAGRHQLSIMVFNQAAHPGVLVSSRELGIYSGAHWQALEADQWKPAVLANDSTTNIPARVEQAGYPTVFTALKHAWPWLVIVFGVSSAWTWWNSRPSQDGEIPPRWKLSPARLRGVLLEAWLVLALNNLGRVPPDIGFDIKDHLEYVKFIVNNHSLPLASDGWQMFQSPLLYLLAAPFYAAFSAMFGPESCVKLLRFLPLLCGMAQIEIAYRVARTVFPKQEDHQKVATIVGGLMPMSIYMSQTFCNEPLAASLTSLVILFCLSLLADPTRRRNFRFFATLGILWGLALLSKVTPLLLTPLIGVVILIHSRTSHASLRQGLSETRTTFGACFLVAGWYYLRNWIYLGSPFVGGWDPSRGVQYQWWQDPSYRTWTQLTSFGSSLNQPVYSGVLSFWDAIYSSMWTDSHLSGTLMPVDQVPWNVNWMEIGVWLAILPTGCILAGLVKLWGQDLRAARSSLLFAVAASGIYLAAIIDLYVHVPVYSAAKASYALGLLPCFGILAAAGSGSFLRFRMLRAIFFGALISWAVAAYVAFFCVR